MFPKFLKVAPCYGRKETVWINKTYFINKMVLSYFDKQHLDVIASALGFSYEVKFPSDEEGCGISLTNGTFNGALGMLQKGEVDMLIDMHLGIDEELNEEFRLSYPHSIYESTFMTRKPVHVPNPAVFLHPFSTQIWFTIIACICLVPFTFHYLLRRRYSALNLFASILGSLVGQGMSLTPRRPREYLVLASWILGSAFLYHFYAAVLLSFVTFPTLQGIRTIEDLANGIKAGTYECAAYPNTGYSHYFIGTEIPALRVIGENLKYYDGDFFIEYLEKSSGDKKPAYVALRKDLLVFKDYYYVTEDNFMTFSFAYVTRKDFFCDLELDKVVHRVWESGIFLKIKAEFDFHDISYVPEQYSNNWHKSSSETILTMTMLKGPFIFLIASHSLAFLVFLMEVCIGKFKKH